MRKFFYLLGIVFLFTVIGCSSISTWVRSNIEGLPPWVYEPQVARNQMAFIGKGFAVSETRARILSLESILTQISQFIGEDITEKAITELSSRQSIDQYRLRITQEFVRQGDGEVEVYLLAVADRQLLEIARTETELLLQRKAKEIQDLSSKATLAYRNNRDLDAVKLYIELALIAKTLPVGRGFEQYDIVLDRVESILSSLQLTVSQGDPRIPQTIVTVKRGARTLSPRVGYAHIKANTTARNGLGLLYEDSQVFVTDETGTVTFVSDNPSLVSSGVIHFSLELTDHVQRLASIDENRAHTIIQIIQNKRVSYYYVRSSPLVEQGVSISILEYTLEGSLRNSTWATQVILESLAKEAINLRKIDNFTTEEEDDILPSLRRILGTKGHAIVGKAGVTSLVRGTDSFRATVSGDLSLYQLSQGTVSKNSGMLIATASGRTQEIAQNEAFKQFGLIATSTITRWLYL